MQAQLQAQIQRPIQYDFTGKVAFVTGAANGIGRATARAYAKAGASVLVADRDEAAGLETCRLITEADGKARFALCDVSQAGSVQAAINTACREFGGVDYAFNNAGVEGEQTDTGGCTPQNWDRVIGINLTGVWLCMKYQIPEMLKRGGGRIVNCASIAGLVGFPELPAYVASKHGVVGLTRAAALEYARRNIQVNAVCPGVIKTAMVDRFTRADPQAEKQMAESAPMGRMGAPEEIAAAVLWLTSPAASFVTGQAFAIDGGWVAQ